MTKPLAIDLYCGLGGWTDGLLAEGYDVIGFDIEQHEYGEHPIYRLDTTATIASSISTLARSCCEKP